MSGLAIVSLIAGFLPFGLVIFGVVVTLRTGGLVDMFSLVTFWVLAAIVAIATGHGARGVIRRTRKLGYIPATIGVSLGYASWALLFVLLVGSWWLVSFTAFGE